MTEVTLQNSKPQMATRITRNFHHNMQHPTWHQFPWHQTTHKKKIKIPRDQKYTKALSNSDLLIEQLTTSLAL